MGRLIPSCRFGGDCYVCGKRFEKGDPIYHVEYSKASHPECQHLLREYVFTNKDRTSTFDILSFSETGDMLMKAFELSAANKETVAVSRKNGSKFEPLFMMAAVPDANLVPALEPEPEVVDGPLFPWPADAAVPF